MREWIYSSTIHDLGTRWWSVVSFTLLPLYPRRNSHRYPMEREGWAVPRAVWKLWRKKNLTPLGNRTPAFHPVVILPELALTLYDFYVGDDRFESQPRHRLSWPGFSWFSSVPTGKLWPSTSVTPRFSLIILSGVRLSPLGTSATNWPIVPAPDDRWWVWSSRWNDNLQGKPMYSEKTCPSATLSSTNPTWPDPGSNPGRRGGKPATNRLSYGTASSDWAPTVFFEILSNSWISPFDATQSRY
jgi:hypothetical protein